MRMLLVTGLALISALGASAGAGGGEGFDPAGMDGHVAVRTALALRAVRGAKTDGRLDEAFWPRTDPVAALCAYASGGPGLKPLYEVGRAPAGPLRPAVDPTFIRVACDGRCLHLAAVCLVAPRPAGTAVQPLEKDMLLLRFDPGARGRHALEIVFDLAGRRRSYDSHENWGHGYVPELEFSGRRLTAEDAERLPGPERQALAGLGAGASGWLMEAAIPWKKLAGEPQPADGMAWGLQATRVSAAGEESSWGRSTFSGFDPQGHVYFLAEPPRVRVDAVTFGRTLEGMTPWTVWLRNASAEPAGARLRLACRQRVENLDFMGARLAPGESRCLVSWMPYGPGVNRVEVRVADGERRPVYGCELLALVEDESGGRVLDSSGGFAGLSVSPQTAGP